MEDRFNTIAGWTLFSGIVALGLSSLSGHYFKANKPHRPHEMGIEIAGVEAEGGGGAAAVPIETLLAEADAAKGEKTFAKCISCHTIAAGGPNGTGPNLHEIVGDAVAQGRGGFAFSDALKSHGGKWDWATMDAWLKSPAAFAKGTKMSFAGLSDPKERANLMVYLNSQGSNLPLPAAPAAAAPAEGEKPAEGAAPADAAKAAAEPAKK
jgi:cytochrome c